MFRGTIWMHNVFTWHSNSSAFLVLCKWLLCLISGHTGKKDPGMEKPLAEQTRWEQALKKKPTGEIFLSNESTGEEIWGVTLWSVTAGCRRNGWMTV